MGPTALDRARMARLAVRVRVALAVPRLRVRATAAAHPLVASLHCSGLLAGRIVEVRLDRRRRVAQAVGDLCNREALGLSIVASQRDSTATLNHSICHWRTGGRRHALDGTAAGWCSLRGDAPFDHIARATTTSPAVVRAGFMALHAVSCGERLRGRCRHAVGCMLGCGYAGSPTAVVWVAVGRV